MDMDPSWWTRFPLVSQHPLASIWLRMQTQLCARNTAEAYGRGVEDFLAFCHRHLIPPEGASREHIATYIHDMATRPRPNHATPGLSNATMQQRLTAIRLFYDHLIEHQLREENPVGRGRYTAGKAFAGQRDRGLLPRYQTLPWIPSD